MQTVGMGAETKSIKGADNKLKKENKELQESMRGLIAQNEALHARIAELEEAQAEQPESKQEK